MPPSPAHARLLTVSLHRLTSAQIPLAAIGAPHTRPSETIDLVSSQALNLLNSLSYSLCIQPLVHPVNLTHYSRADLAALASLDTRLDQLGFSRLADFTTHPFCLYTPLATARLPDFFPTPPLVTPSGHILEPKRQPPSDLQHLYPI